MLHSFHRVACVSSALWVSHVRVCGKLDES